MSNAIVVLLLVPLILIATVLMAASYFTGVDLVSVSLSEMSDSLNHDSRTRISKLSSVVGTQSQNVRVTLENKGETPLNDFDRWDVIVQYYGGTLDPVTCRYTTYFIKWLPHTASTTPSNNQWRVEGLFQDEPSSKSEVFAPGIFDPEEDMKLHMKIQPDMAALGRAVSHREN